MVALELSAGGVQYGVFLEASAARALRADAACAVSLPVLDVRLAALRPASGTGGAEAGILAALNSPFNASCRASDQEVRRLEEHLQRGRVLQGEVYDALISLSLAIRARTADGDQAPLSLYELQAQQELAACEMLAALQILNASDSALGEAFAGTSAAVVAAGSAELTPVYRLLSVQQPVKSSGEPLQCASVDDGLQGGAAQAAIQAAASATPSAAGGAVAGFVLCLVGAAYAFRRYHRRQAQKRGSGAAGPVLVSPLHAAAAVKMDDVSPDSSGSDSDPRSPVASGATPHRAPPVVRTLRLDDDLDLDDAGDAEPGEVARVPGETGTPRRELKRLGSLALSRRTLSTAAQPEDAARWSVEPKRVTSIRKSQQFGAHALEALGAAAVADAVPGGGHSDSDSPALAEQGRAKMRPLLLASPSGGSFGVLSPAGGGKASARPFLSARISLTSPMSPVLDPSARPFPGRDGGLDIGGGSEDGQTFEHSNPMLARARSVHKALILDLPIDYTAASASSSAAAGDPAQPTWASEVHVASNPLAEAAHGRRRVSSTSRPNSSRSEQSLA